MILEEVQRVLEVRYPQRLSALSATAASSTQINLAWTDNSNNEDGFRIERCQDAGCSTFTEIATVGANVVSYQNTGLTAGDHLPVSSARLQHCRQLRILEHCQCDDDCHLARSAYSSDSNSSFQHADQSGVD